MIIFLWIIFSAYRPIKSQVERQKYKRDFNCEYSEYLDLHKNIERRLAVFKELNGRLKQLKEGSAEYQVGCYSASFSHSSVWQFYFVFKELPMSD